MEIVALRWNSCLILLKWLLNVVSHKQIKMDQPNGLVCENQLRICATVHKEIKWHFGNIEYSLINLDSLVH